MNKKIMIVFLSLVFMLIGIQNYLFYKTKIKLENFIWFAYTDPRFGAPIKFDELSCAPSYYNYPILMETIFIKTDVNNIKPYYGVCKVHNYVEGNIYLLLYIDNINGNLRFNHNDELIINKK